MTSPPQPDRAAVVGQAQNLADALNGVSKRLEKVDRYGRRSRLFILFDILLTLVVSAALYFASAAAQTANQTRQASATSCQSGNDIRQAMTGVFDHIFSAFQPSAGETTAQKATQRQKIKVIEAYYHLKFTSRNCTAIYGVTPATSAGPGTGKQG